VSVVGEAAVWGVVIGGALVVGALAGAILPMRERLATTATVFGGGILLGALAFGVVPEAEEHAGDTTTALGFLGGALAFLAIDWLLTRDEGRAELRRALQAGAASGDGRTGGKEEVARGETIALGIFTDGVPETAALGVTIAEGQIGVALLAGVLVSNLVESYGATQPIVHGGHSRWFAVLLFAGIAGALVAAIVLGSTLLLDAGDTVIGIAQAVAGGAIFATVTTAIVPHAFAEVSRWAAVAAGVGFLVGYLLA
jgi:zinc transporter, ZIP family